MLNHWLTFHPVIVAIAIGAVLTALVVLAAVRATVPPLGKDCCDCCDREDSGK